MAMDEGKVTYGIHLGFQLGRLEFLWGSPFEEAQAAFEPSKQQILRMLEPDLHPEETSFRAFSESIMNYYMRNHVEFYSLIMIGISLQRCILLSACHTEEKRSEMIQLAQSPVLAIPSSVVEDKGLLFSILLKNREKSIPEVSALIYSMFFSSASNPSLAGKSPAPGQNPAFNQTGNKYLFISYSSKDVVVAEELRSLLEKAGIKCWIAPHSIPVGSDYTEVIVDAIEKSSGVVLLLSGNSQDSKWVPKELDIAISSEKVIFPIHIDRTEIIKKIYFRLTDSQVIEAGGNIESIFGELVDAVRALWNK